MPTETIDLFEYQAALLREWGQNNGGWYVRPQPRYVSKLKVGYYYIFSPHIGSPYFKVSENRLMNLKSGELIDEDKYTLMCSDSPKRVLI